METHQHLVKVFIQKFEKKRKWNFLIPSVIISSLESFIISAGVFHYYGHQYPAILLFIFSFLSIFVVVGLLILWTDEFNDIKALSDTTLKTLDQLINEKISYERLYGIHNYRKQKLEKFLCWIRNEKNYINSPDTIWIDGIVKILDIEKGIISQYTQDIEEIEGKIELIQIEFDGYALILEKTAWQYFWSYKWIKKQNDNN